MENMKHSVQDQVRWTRTVLRSGIGLLLWLLVHCLNLPNLWVVTGGATIGASDDLGHPFPRPGGGTGDRDGKCLTGYRLQRIYP